MPLRQICAHRFPAYIFAPTHERIADATSSHNFAGLNFATDPRRLNRSAIRRLGARPDRLRMRFREIAIAIARRRLVGRCDRYVCVTVAVASVTSIIPGDGRGGGARGELASSSQVEVFLEHAPRNNGFVRGWNKVSAVSRRALRPVVIKRCNLT